MESRARYICPVSCLRLWKIAKTSLLICPSSEGKPFTYEEFGSILLLVLAFRHKFDLAPSDLGLRDHTSFLGRLVENRNSIPMKLDSLPDKVKGNLGIWIMALFVSEGINSESTGTCSPQEYYSIIPLIMDQIIVACESGKLTYEILKSGIDCKFQ